MIGRWELNLNFLECIRDNRQATPSFYDGIYNARLLDKIRLSEAKSAWIKV